MEAAHFFEGTEKLLEVWFSRQQPDANQGSGDLRTIPRWVLGTLRPQSGLGSGRLEGVSRGRRSGAGYPQPVQVEAGRRPFPRPRGAAPSTRGLRRFLPPPLPGWGRPGGGGEEASTAACSGDAPREACGTAGRAARRAWAACAFRLPRCSGLSGSPGGGASRRAHAGSLAAGVARLA